ncbi:MAG: hypothetical protein IKO28_06960 [Prevotella sp.]|nr:hypothetical protein [Prevotella sp.]
MDSPFNYVDVLRWAHKELREKGLCPSERFLFLYLIHRTNECFWRQLSLTAKTVAKETGISRTSLFNYKKNLIKKDLLVDDEGFKINLKKFPRNEINRRRSKNLEVGDIPEEDYANPL